MKKTINPLKLVIGILGLSSVAALVGSISGTVAWYAYSTRALVSYTGTSAQSSTQLQIGIKSSEDIPALRNNQLIETVEVSDASGDYYCYFTHLGSGGMPSSIINTFLQGNGYATSTLEPVSTYKYTTGGNFELMNCPTTNKPEERSAAPTAKYIKIPFVFRVFSAGSDGIVSTQTPVGNQKIYLSNAVTKAEEGDIDKAIRLHIDRNGQDENSNNLTDFVFNPNKEENGLTKVAGVLDLSGNGYFDFDNNPANQGTTYLHEFIYGDYRLKDNVSWTLQENDDDLLFDVNSTGITDAGTTFTSKHRQGTYHLDCAGSTTKTLEDYIDIDTAAYLGTNTVFPDKTNGILSGDYYVCKTADDVNKLGSFDLTIYIEGWDHATINQHSDKEFNLGLTFEISPAD